MPLYKTFAARARAHRANQRGMRFDDEGALALAIEEYQRAARIDPSWSVPFYNLGLAYKYSGDWQRSFENNESATMLAPDDEAAWWNLGIAATALGRWDVARMAWRGAGLDIATGDAPIDHSYGPTPIRLNPDGESEVVWADRLDPARAVLRSIPFPESGFRYGDLVLHDGAAAGHRLLRGEEVPVFDCLGLLGESRFSTYVAELEVERIRDPAELDIFEELSTIADERELAAENWSRSVRVLCKACSEGWSHEPGGANHDYGDGLEDDSADPERRQRVGIAAPDVDGVQALLADWQARVQGVTVVTLQMALRAGAERDG